MADFVNVFSARKRPFVSIKRSLPAPAWSYRQGSAPERLSRRQDRISFPPRTVKSPSLRRPKEGFFQDTRTSSGQTRRQEQVDAKLDKIDARFDKLDAHITKLFEKIERNEPRNSCN